MARALPSRTIRLFTTLITLLLAISFSAQADSAHNSDRSERDWKFVTSDGQLDVAKLEQFRIQRKLDIHDTKSGTTAQAGSMTVLDSTVSSYWETAAWVDSVKHHCFYDVNGRLSFSTRQHFWRNGQPDTNTNYYNYNTSFAYDDSDRLAERIEYNWRTKYEFYFLVRTICSYNPDGSLIDSVEQFWEDQREQWGNSGQTRCSYVYDVNGNQTDFLVQRSQWDENPPNWRWENSWRVMSVFDGSNYRTEYTEEWWDWGMSAWVYGSRVTCEYDGHGNLIDSTTHGWEDDQWVAYMKYTYTYDHDDNQIGELHQYEDGGQWINTWKFTYGYDAYGNQISFLEQYWEVGSWENSWRDASTYDGDRITEYIGEYWNWSINQWIVYDRLTYAYDLDGNETDYLEQLWESSQWINDTRRTSHYSIKTSVATGTGSDIEVDLNEGVTLVFDSVGTAGNTGVTVGTDGPASDAFVILPANSPEYYYINTDAGFSDSIEICITYIDDLLTPAEEADLALYHYYKTAWADITTSKDIDSNLICGKTVNLSPFVVGTLDAGETCCGLYTSSFTGNTDCDTDGKRNIADVTRLIDRVYLTKAPLCCEENGNTDGDVDGKMNIADITRLIDNIWLSKQETAVCE